MKIKKYFLAFLGSGFLVRVFSQQQPIPVATNVYIRKHSCSFFSWFLDLRLIDSLLTDSSDG